MTKEELLSRFDILRTEYIKLLNDRDVLLNWGKPQLEALYATRIGVYQVEQLQLELRIKALKRKIEMVRSAIVRNLPLDINAIERQVAAELAEAELLIMEQVVAVESGKALLTNLESPQRSSELRQVFRQLAKQLHPDVNPNLTFEQQNIWQMVTDAYNIGDLEKLKALQIVYEKEIINTETLLQQLTEEQLALKNTTLAEGIKQLQLQLADIKNNFPFTIEQDIKDDSWVKQQQDALQDAIKKLRTFEGDLILEYQSLISGYGGSKPELN